MFLQAMNKAMRYYRIWIYSCNLALLFGTIVYIIAFIYILNDDKMILFPTIKLYEPTFLYCYCALIVQGGILQTIGCFGAMRLNEKLLNIYLLLMIALLFGDGIVGIIWILRFNSIIANLRGDLKTRLINDYFVDEEFQDIWNNIQSSHKCCGVDSAYDYNLNDSIKKVPNSCCRVDIPILPNEHLSIKHKCVTGYDPDLIYFYGCYDHIHHWFQQSADLLSVLGFCVLSFIKVCFLCILRYEIKEMIQKIKVLKGMTEIPVVPVHDLEAYLPRPSVQQDSNTTLLTNIAPQSTYRTGCTTEKHHHFHHHLATSTLRVNAVTNGNNNDLSLSQSKKHSVV